MKSSSLLAAILGGALAAAACGGGAPPPAPPPFRPAPVADPTPPPTTDEAPADCAPTTAATQKPALTFDRRSIPEADKLAREGLGQLQSAEAPGIDPSAREMMITGAVELFINALLADPYNVEATYNLAAAYARIDRRQCAINLLERLIQMRDHESKKGKVEDKLDRLLGRNKKSLDPDFHAMRGDPRFRELIRGMCAGTQDPGCVFGN